MTGIVFDLDGTLVNNMGLHADAFAMFCTRHNLPPFTAELRARLDGKRNRDIFPVLFGRPLGDAELKELIDEKEGLYRELSRGVLEPMPGLLDLLDRLDARGIPVAVATSAPADNVRHTLGELGLEHRLATVVRADEVPRGKPHPDVFLAAARALGIDPKACVAFEDAPMGVKAARAAGMRCVAVTTSFDEQDFVAHQAAPDHLVADFTEYLAGPGDWLRAA